MKKKLKKLTAAAVSAVIAAGSSGLFPVTAADSGSDTSELTIVFDISGEGVSIAENEDGEIPELNDIATTTSASVFIPDVQLEREGYIFSCWTADNIRAYEPGDVYRTPDSVTDNEIVFEPVWIDENDHTFYSVTYVADIDGVNANVDNEVIAKGNYLQGRPVTISVISFQRNDAKQHGWTDGVNDFLAYDKFVMPDHDVTLNAIWGYYYSLIYYAGDVDRMISGYEAIYSQAATYPRDLADESRFSRQGFTVAGWICDYDGKEYALKSSYLMPYSDVTMTAVWTPVKYNVLFRAGTGNTADNIKVPGYTDETITVPELTATKSGYTFAGWSYNNVTYQPGDDFLIEGAAPGVGIAVEAIWVKGSVTTTTATTTTTAPPTGTNVVYGDANCNGTVEMADAVLILQSQSNPDKYGENGTDEEHITALGLINADCSGSGDGVTASDALAVQKYILKLIPSLPEE